MTCFVFIIRKYVEINFFFPFDMFDITKKINKTVLKRYIYI